MIIKVFTLFLIVMAALAMFGRLRIGGRSKKPPPSRLSVARCPKCGKPRIGAGPCDCGDKA